MKLITSGKIRYWPQIRAIRALAGYVDDGSRFPLRHEVLRTDGKLSARVTSAGGWFDLNEQKLVAPTPALLAAMNALEKTDDFVVLPSGIKTRT